MGDQEVLSPKDSYLAPPHPCPSFSTFKWVIHSSIRIFKWFPFTLISNHKPLQTLHNLSPACLPPLPHCRLPSQSQAQPFPGCHSATLQGN